MDLLLLIMVQFSHCWSVRVDLYVCHSQVYMLLPWLQLVHLSLRQLFHAMQVCPDSVSADSGRD